MSEERESKRVREACANCRRKKTRCSGERPVCAFCARLGQECRYTEDIYLESATAAIHGPTVEENARLASRVALLESRLALLSSKDDNAAILDIGSSPAQQSETSNEFASLLDTQTMQDLTDIYFRHCHQQPYTFFNEASFRKSLHDGVLPTYLLWAVAATAVRFSDDIRFLVCQAEAIDTYSKLAWNSILQQSFSDAHDLNIRTVQAANMLGTVDFVVGRTQLAWVKAGLAVRFAQTLQMSKEPHVSLSSAESEERRHTFWSVYLLDRLMSCGRDRPPLLLDTDCTIRLPTNPCSIRTECGTEIPTLAAIHEIPSIALLEKTDHFALTIFMVSTLGQITRWVFHHNNNEARLPWDSRSEFSRIKGILTSFESYSDACDGNFANILDQHFVSHGVLDDSVAAHFTYSHIVYNLNQCLLHHPFLLRQRLVPYRIKVPPAFLRAAIAKSREHAEQISAILRIVQKRACKTYPSFFGYAAVVAGIIHRLHSINYQSSKQDEASNNWQSCLRFLDEQSVRWNSFERMSKLIREFKLTPSLAANLLSTTMDRTPLDPEIEDGLWQMCDYSTLTNSIRSLPVKEELQQKPALFAAGESIDMAPSGQTPDFEALYQGALSLDYALLDDVNNGMYASDFTTH